MHAEPASTLGLVRGHRQHAAGKCDSAAGGRKLRGSFPLQHRQRPRLRAGSLPPLFNFQGTLNQAIVDSVDFMCPLEFLLSLSYFFGACTALYVLAVCVTSTHLLCLDVCASLF